MTDKEDLLKSYKAVAESNSIQANDNLNAHHRMLLEYYTGEYKGDVVEGESQVVSTDVFDVIEADMPSLVRTFLSGKEIMRFEPVRSTEKERQIAEEKTTYLNHLIRGQQSSYKTLVDWLKGAELYRYSAVYFGYETEDKVRTVDYEGVSDDDLAALNLDMDEERQAGANIDFEELDRKQDDGLHNVRVTIAKETGNYFVRYIEPENFVITERTDSVENAQIVGHDEYVTKSDLVVLGYDKDVIKELPVNSKPDYDIYNTLDKSNGGSATLRGNHNPIHWTGEVVRLEIRFLKYDMDDDGIAERLRVISVGDTILEVEPYEIAPYAVLSAVQMPNRLIGLSRADLAKQTQDIKTALVRQTLMNMYHVNAHRTAVNEDVELDDVLTTRVGGVIRVHGKGNPGAAVMPLQVPFTADKSLAVMQYVDVARAQRTGSLQASQSLTSDQLHKETATRFRGVQDASQSKVELIARNFAEIGFRTLFEGMLWTVKHFQKTSTEVMVLGKELSIDPRRWLTDQPVNTSVGLGVGDDEETVTNMTGILQVQQQLATTESPLVDQSKMYNTLSRSCKAIDISDVSELFNNPSIPEEMLQPALEQTLAQNQALQAAVKELQLATDNPLAEAEEIKAQARLIEAQAKQQLEAAKLAENQRQFDLKTIADQQKRLDELQAQYTEMELKYNQDVPGSSV
jgi:hypothetical protein